MGTTSSSPSGPGGGKGGGGGGPKIKGKGPSVEAKIKTASSTSRLVLSNKKLKRIPGHVFQLSNLKLLDLSENDIEEVGPQIGNLKALGTLKLDGNPHLGALPHEISLCENLNIFTASRCKLSTMEAVLPKKKLTQLDLSHNNFSGEVGHPILALPPSVTSANLSYNAITSLSISFGFEALTKLESLDLSNNQLSVIPPAIGHCTKLQVLHLRNNNIVTLPPELFKNTRLSIMSLEGNQIDKKQFLELEGVDEFMERRKARVSKEIYGGVIADTSICGLD